MILRDHIYADFNYLNTNDLGCIDFPGRFFTKRAAKAGQKDCAVGSAEIGRMRIAFMELIYTNDLCTG